MGRSYSGKAAESACGDPGLALAGRQSAQSG